MRSVWLITWLFLAGLMVAPATAKRMKSDPGPHPIKILKAKINNSSGGLNSAKGDMSIWMQNTSDVLVDKVRVDVQFFSRSGRLLDKKTKEIGNVEPGAKAFADFKWDIVGEQDVKPQIWIFYNGGLDRLTQFEADPPVW